jgi:hypothetical protein
LRPDIILSVVRQTTIYYLSLQTLGMNVPAIPLADLPPLQNPPVLQDITNRVNRVGVAIKRKIADISNEGRIDNRCGTIG